jgi:hypothetical protein
MTSDEASGPGDGKRARLPFDIGVAHQARMYDYVLGGKDNYAADREAVEAGLKAWPDMAFSMRANRAFLGRAVRYLAGQAGIRQFLDIGTGIPTSGNTHEVAQAIAPETRVVYVDYDPVVLAHARALLDSNEAGATEYIDADLRDTDLILRRAAGLLDFAKPVAVTLLAVLHVIPDADDPYAIVGKLMGAVPLRSGDERQLQERRGPHGPAAVHPPQPRAGSAVFHGHGHGRARPGTGRGVAARARPRQHPQVACVGRGGTQELTQPLLSRVTGHRPAGRCRRR